MKVFLKRFQLNGNKSFFIDLEISDSFVYEEKEYYTL